MAIVSHHSVLIASACVAGDGHVVAHGDVVEAGRLAGLGDLHELGRPGPALPGLRVDRALGLDGQLQPEG